jgi:uncharacterized protein (TIGR00299 family) protein
MRKILYYDCFAGISGDMNLGALIDLGVDPEYLKNELEKLNIDGFHLEIKRDLRKGISGTKADVIIENQENEKHRHLRHIEELINNSSLSESIKETSLKIFDLVAEAEAKVHDITKQQVHFHEVGALDSIADIVGAAICLNYLNVDEVLSSPIQLGGGFVKCAHGKMPVPAPATAEIVKDIPVKTGLIEHEATTPTGAAIIVATVDRYVTDLNLKITKTGYGLGTRDSEIPNVLRVYLAESEGDTDLLIEEATLLECNIDDMNPEWFEHVSEELFSAGADEVFLSPCTMKKMRPGTILSVLCGSDVIDRVKEVIFSSTPTIGLREQQIKKNVLRREFDTISTEYGKVQIKKSYYKNRLVNVKPEYEDCKKLASGHNVPIKDVYDAVVRSTKS